MARDARGGAAGVPSRRCCRGKTSCGGAPRFGRFGSGALCTRMLLLGLGGLEWGMLRGGGVKGGRSCRGGGLGCVGFGGGLLVVVLVF